MTAFDRHHESSFWNGAIPVGAPQRPSFGVLFVWSVPLLSGLLPFLDVQVGQFTTRGYLWVLMLMVAGTTLLLEKAVNSQSRSRLPCAPWLLFLGLIWLSLLWVESLQRRHIQVAMQLSLPLFMGVLSSVFVTEEHQLKVLLKMFFVGFVLTVLADVARLTGILASEVAGTRPQAITLGLLAAVFLGSSPPRHIYAFFGWLACLAIAASSGGRIATLAILILPLVHPLYRGRWLLRTFLLASALLIGASIFYTPTFQARFFHRGSGTLADVVRGDINTSGRMETWAVLWDESLKRPMLGSGVGSSMVFLESGRWTTDIITDHAHNDYLRILFEIGFIGLACFVGAIVWQMVSVARAIRVSHGSAQTAFAASLLGWYVFAILATTDNIIIYTVQFMVPLFVLMGAAYGVSQTQSIDNMELTRSLNDNQLPA